MVRANRLMVSFFFASAFGLMGLTVSSQADYPWVHYFKRPDMACIHTAFPDAEGGVIVATGDWRDWHSEPGLNVWEYFSTGVYRIECGSIEQLTFPHNSFVFDGAVDSGGKTWVLLGEGRDAYDSLMVRSPCLSRDVGFRIFKYPFCPLEVVNRRLAVLDNTGLLECPELTDAIPGIPRLLTSDPEGRVLVLSTEIEGTDVIAHFLSWWDGQRPESVHTVNISEMFPSLLSLTEYPHFCPDGLVYLKYSMEASLREYKHVFVSIDLQTGESDIYDENRCTFLASLADHLWMDSFYVDPMNVKWFSTQEGLVRFDGENWSRYTTDNSGLPHNLVIQMAYDEIDSTYYVVTRDPDSTKAFSLFSSHGQRIAEPLYLGSSLTIYRGAGDVWYLVTANDTFDDDLIYAYDHATIEHWWTSTWLDLDFYLDFRYIGPAGSGRTFLVGRNCVMVW